MTNFSAIALWRGGGAISVAIIEQGTPTDMMLFGFKKVFELGNVPRSILGGFIND